jgi:hypothetical protein
MRRLVNIGDAQPYVIDANHAWRIFLSMTHNHSIFPQICEDL